MYQPEIDIALIVACAQNGVIGRNNKLPWHLPNDLQYFKSVTLGKPIIMGRKTYESIGRPLPGRTNIVVSGSWVVDQDMETLGIKLAKDLDQALIIAEGVALIDGVAEIMIIGGAQLYAQVMSICQRIYLTEVHADVEGDSFFNLPDKENVWREVSRENFTASGANPYDYSFCVLEKQPSTK